MSLPDASELIGSNVTEGMFKQKLRQFLENCMPIDQMLDKEVNLNLLGNIGVYVCRYDQNAKYELNYPEEHAGYLSISRFDLDSAIYQEYTTTYNKKYIRSKTGDKWSNWVTLASLNDVEESKNPIALLSTQSLNEVRMSGLYIARFDSVASFEMNYPVKGAGILTVLNNPGDSTVFQEFKTLNNVQYKRTYTNGLWSEWVALSKENDTFYQLFTSDVVAYDFSNIECAFPAKINKPLSRIFASKGADYLVPYFSDGEVVIGYSKGKNFLIGKNSNKNNRLYSSKPLLGSLNSSIAFSFKYVDSTQQLNVIWQHEGGMDGRLQINVNAKYNGSSLVYEPDVLQFFLHGVTGGGGINGNILSKKIEAGVIYRVQLILAEGEKSSQLYINGKLHDAFTVSKIANVKTQVVGFNTGSTHSVQIFKILAVQEVISKEQVDEVDYWLGKLPAEGRTDILNEINLTSTQAAASAIIPRDGIYDEKLLLYVQNPQHIAMQASLTKVMTSIVLLDMAPSLTDLIERTPEDSGSGSGANLNVGDKISIYSALRNLMLPSSNVTANMIARIYGGIKLIESGVSEFTTAQALEQWVIALNIKAQELGMANTIFDSASGLDISDLSPAKTTVIDMLKMMCYATKYPDLMSAWSEPFYNMPVLNASNVERIIKIFTTVIPLKEGDIHVFGGKTGTLNRYGYNVGEIGVMPDGRMIALVTMGAKSDYDRTVDIRQVMAVNAQQFDWVSPPNKLA